MTEKTMMAAGVIRKRPGRPREGVARIATNLRLKTSLVQRLRTVCREGGLSQTEAMDQALQMYLEEMGY